MNDSPQLVSKILAQLTMMWLLHTALLFAFAGTLHWRGAWIFLGYYVVTLAITSGLVLPGRKDLVRERWEEKRDVKAWDKVLMPIAAILLPIIIVVTAGIQRRLGGLDSENWMSEVAGLIIGLASCGVLLASMLTNRFFSANARIQSDRSHTVVSGGPYSVIRHPGYVGMILYATSMPLMLSSSWGIWPAAIMIGLVILRTYLEDSMLRQELPGYVEYSKKVRYRLAPGIW